MTSNWAVIQLRKLLPLDDDSLQQILDYSNTLTNDAAADHLKNMLGDSPQALEFISTYNSKRQPQGSSLNTSNHGAVLINQPPPPVPKFKHNKKKKADIHKLPAPRQVQNFGIVADGYIKKSQEDYIPARSEPIREFKKTDESFKANLRPLTPEVTPQIKLPPSASGKLISDVRKPAPKQVKAAISGGTPMKGKSTALSDLEIVIRNLEIQTNPTLTPTAEENARRKCNCMATKHDLLSSAPNCLNCGKIICVKEGIGPCTYCNTPLLSPTELQAMIRVLKEENGREKQETINSSHKRAEVSKMPRPFSRSPNRALDESSKNSSKDNLLSAATQQRDRLLTFQDQNARRTRVHDEAADFDVPSSGTNIWDTPQKRAMELKRQQKALREMEWRARPEWEKRSVVASIEIGSGGKAKLVKKMAAVERPRDPEDDIRVEEDMHLDSEGSSEKTNTLGKNPLLGKLLRPIAKVDVKGKGIMVSKPSGWRRVQDDASDNEQWILDGGIKGSGLEDKSEEPACG